MPRKITMPPHQPLGEPHYQALQQILEGTQAARQLVARATRAGLNMTPALQRLEQLEAMAQGIKREFFPQRS